MPVCPHVSPQIQVGGSEAYEARCRRCHDVPSDQRYQTSLLDLLGSTPADPVVLTRESLKRHA